MYKIPPGHDDEGEGQGEIIEEPENEEGDLQEADVTVRSVLAWWKAGTIWGQSRRDTLQQP